jgi:hypothetical protein
MSNPANPTVQLIIGDTKVNVELRYDAGVKIAKQAPQSPLYGLHPDIKAAADEVAAKNLALKAANDGYHTALAALTLTRGVLVQATGDWDAAFDVYLKTGAKYVVTTADAASLALAVRGSTHNPLAMPLAVLLTYNPKKDWLRVHVQRAPGMEVVTVQTTLDLTNPASWKELDGHGAIHVVNHPTPGTWWVRACSKSAHATSDFTTPVSIIIK